MNILFLSCWYPSAEKPFKGVFIREHARAVQASGNKVVVLALSIESGSGLFNKKVERFTDEFGLETHIIHVHSILYKWIYINPFQLYAILSSYFRKEIQPVFNADIVHSNILYPCALLGDRLAGEIKKPHVITEHWSKIDKYMRKNIFSSDGKKAYENAAAITTVSHFLKATLNKYVSDPSKVKVVPNIIDTNLFAYIPKSLSSDKIVFACIATWTPPKQPMLFVRALEDISKSSLKDIELNIVGEGILLEEVKKFNAGFTIRYHGNLPRKRIAEVLQGADYFLHASDIETFSMVCAEALSTGTPVVASRVGAIPELISDLNGVLTENTKEAWFKAIQKVVHTPYDNLNIRRMVLEKFSKDIVANKFQEIYKALV